MSNFDRKSIKPYFANLTIGGGAVAWSICRDSKKDLLTQDFHNSLVLQIQVIINSAKVINHPEV